MDRFILRNIYAYMNRKVLSFVHLPALCKQLLQFFVQAGFFSMHSEVIAADPAAVLITERVCQHLRKSPQELVALMESVLRIEELHSAEIRIHQNRNAALFPNFIPALLRRFKEV